ncbi:hypothetical protein FQN60_014371 [Etheostoma spectabile]|uniref:Sushi domain-containing protein n=1 Tax=Etheostoma spectabile TaxID=54343 RepID=A0A5J5D8M0_9PERO|nr:hypothetical protein FQN60_014371 [Etheostoma spectabile]
MWEPLSSSSFNISGNGGRRRVEGGGRRAEEELRSLKNPELHRDEHGGPVWDEERRGRRGDAVSPSRVLLFCSGVSLHPRPAELAAAGGEDAGGPRGVVPAGPALPQEEDERPTQQHHGDLQDRRLGRVFGIGHEIHFLCKPGYELIGPRTRVCLDSLRWSGQQPMCRPLNSSRDSLASFSPAAPASSFPVSAALSASSSSSSSTSSAASSPPPVSSTSPTSSSPPSSVRPSHCTHFLGSTRCTCDCVNTPGSFHCFCPDGYDLARDGRSCTDFDECENRMHNCTADQVCVNTYGGFQCAAVECPHVKNATYIKTSPMRCERNPCMLGDRACAQAPNSISFHFLSVVSNMSAPRVLFRVSAARVLGDTLRFGLAGGRGRGHFSVQRSGRQTGTLLLVTPIGGPATLEAEVEMSELERSNLLGRYLTKVTLFVSPYEF